MAYLAVIVILGALVSGGGITGRATGGSGCADEQAVRAIFTEMDEDALYNDALATEDSGDLGGFEDSGDSASLQSACDVEDVFERNGCLACHGADAERAGGGLNLTASEREASLVGVASNSPGCAEEVLVNVDNPMASMLLHNVAADRYFGEVGSECSPIPMPLGGASVLPEDDVDCLEEWIRTRNANDDPPDVTYAAPALTVLTRVKYVLNGGAVTADELGLASDTDGELLPEGLEQLVQTWMSMDRFRDKRRQFLELHLQQIPSDGDYYNQYRNTGTKAMIPVRDALNHSMIRTAERIIDNGEDFRSIVNTTTWEVTTATLLALKMADNPMILKPNGVWPKNNAINDLRYVTRDLGLYDRELDSADWRTVTLVHNPSSTDMTTEADFMDPDQAAALRAVPDGGSIELRSPRMGFFSSPAFFQVWPTNSDNDFRVIINQAVIVATGQTFSAGDTTQLAGDGAAVDEELFPRDSSCYGCHKNLDVMRPAFLAVYDHTNTRHTDADPTLPRPGFSFQGQSVEVNGLQEWADALANHPDFAVAWVLKLCQWASSAECSATDESVQVLAWDFASSGYDLTELFASFFTSPLVTQTSDRLDTVAPGAQVSLARYGHYCSAMRARLSDIRVAQGHADELPAQLDLCREDGPTSVLSASLPRDQVVRGSTSLHQPRDATAMVSIAFEGMCSVSAEEIVDASDRAAFHPRNPTQALDLMNGLLLGFPPGTDTHDRTGDLLERTFRALTASPACTSPGDFRAALASDGPTCGLELTDENALRDIWTMACQSPSLTGVGL
ncbi:MAG: hypothetical protein CL927_07740 [Deltaproteobacteria bacterium]|nr:hypothetical protein [Deltaproteobacteria bacterium]